jgi:hypothetical protein
MNDIRMSINSVSYEYSFIIGEKTLIAERLFQQNRPKAHIAHVGVLYFIVWWGVPTA